jgi:hypothetical protein
MVLPIMVPGGHYSVEADWNSRRELIVEQAIPVAMVTAVITAAGTVLRAWIQGPPRPRRALSRHGLHHRHRVVRFLLLNGALQADAKDAAHDAFTVSFSDGQPGSPAGHHRKGSMDPNGGATYAPAAAGVTRAPPHHCGRDTRPARPRSRTRRSDGREAGMKETSGDGARPERMTDEQLDRLLMAASTDLLDHVKATADLPRDPDRHHRSQQPGHPPSRSMRTAR